MTTITASTMKFLLFMPQAIAEGQTALSPSLLVGVFPSAIAKQIGDATNFMFVTPLLEIVSTGGFLILRGVGLFNPGGRLVSGCSLLLEEDAHGKEQPRLSIAWLVLSMTLFFPVTSA